MSILTNPLNDPDLCRKHKIRPWDYLDIDDYLVDAPDIGNEEGVRILNILEKYGICQIRRAGQPPSEEMLLDLEATFGDAYNSQNNYQGKIKSIHPEFDKDPIGGDSAQELLVHTDGTQNRRTPALLAFQYCTRPNFGGHSTFLDMANILSKFPPTTAHKILSGLAHSKSVSYEKDELNFHGPMFTTECDDRAISCRINMKLANVHEDGKEMYELLINEINDSPKLTLKPKNGDIIIFDNWRLLHGRLKIGGYVQRIHDRIWIKELKSPYESKFLGIRPISIELLSKIKQINVGIE